MTTHEERISMFLRSLDISKKLKEEGTVTREEIVWLLHWLREYIAELDLTLNDLESLKVQLNSKQSVIDNKKEDN